MPPLDSTLPEQAILAVTTLADGTLEITAESGALTITVLSPPAFAGVYETTTAAMALGPINLVAPQISQTGASGEILTAVSGLWVFDAQSPAPTVAYQWLQDGVPLTGETSLTLTGAATNVTLGLTQTLTQTGTGQSGANSATIMIADQSQTVTIPAGTVSADLPGFPVRFDLADLSTELWDQLRSDGGNLRATNATDDISYPLDVVWIDSETRRGTAFLRRDLTAASNTDFVWRARPSAQTAALPTSPDGQQAVWIDYLAVLAFPGRTDRTGKNSVTEVGAFTNSYTLEKVSPDIQMHQGMVWDGTHWYVVDTNQIKKFDANWTLIQTANNPIAAAGISGVNHLGDPCLHNGELLIPLELWPSGPFTNQHIAVYSTADLSFVRSHNISAAGREASSFAINLADGNLYCTDFLNGADIPYFTPDGTYLGVLTLSQPINQLQGIVFHAGKMFLSSDDGDRLYEALPDGTVTPAPVYTSLLGGSFEGITSDGTDLYVLIDSAPSCVYRLRPAQFSDQLQFSTNMLQVTGLASQGAWTSSVSVTPYAIPNNGAISSMVRSGAESNRATAVVRASSTPKSYNAWSSGNSWMAPGTIDLPVISKGVRMAYGFNGAGARKLNLNGAAYANQSGVANLPGGSNTIWSVGAEDSSPSEFVKGTLAFAFLFDGYASDTRLAAEYLSLHDTQNFYVAS